MAKIVGPLMSVDARGNWAKGALQFRGGLKRCHAYRPAPPGTVNQKAASTAQASQRQLYRDALESWRALDDASQADWDGRAEPLGLSGWNLFFRETRSAEQGAQDLQIGVLIGDPPLSTDLGADASRPIASRTLNFARFLS